jgi:hypothetical protein
MLIQRDITREFYVTISNPLDVKFSQIHAIAVFNMNLKLNKFNTPNSENSRDLLNSQTGYDPIANWIWDTRGYSGQQTRDFLNEIMKVRHSFAHGFPMPSYDWNLSPSGNPRLTKAILEDCKAFFLFMVKRTDNGLKIHVQTRFGIGDVWD